MQKVDVIVSGRDRTDDLARKSACDNHFTTETLMQIAYICR